MKEKEVEKRIIDLIQYLNLQNVQEQDGALGQELISKENQILLDTIQTNSGDNSGFLH